MGMLLYMMDLERKQKAEAKAAETAEKAASAPSGDGQAEMPETVKKPGRRPATGRKRVSK